MSKIVPQAGETKPHYRRADDEETLAILRKQNEWFAERRSLTVSPTDARLEGVYSTPRARRLGRRDDAHR
jgi:hypothetical protein